MSEINCLITVILQWQRYALRERDKNGDRNRDRKSERETEKDRDIIVSFYSTTFSFCQTTTLSTEFETVRKR